MLDPIPPPALEEYLLETGIIDRSQLSLAKKLQHRQQGPLLMILLELSFIDLEQLSRLLDLGRIGNNGSGPSRGSWVFSELRSLSSFS